MKTAVYCGTKEIYEDMIPSIKSLLINSNVQKIYLLIEDDTFPYYLPKQCECINVSNQKFFSKQCLNYDTRCTWMCLMRTVLSKIFPNIDMVLSLDADTIVKQDISDLWDLDLSNYYYAGVKEFAKSKIGNGYNCPIYLNGGVLLCNLKRLREKKKDDQIIERLNKNYYAAAEQDAINFSCQGNLLNLPICYNENEFTGKTDEPKIVHYAGIKEWNNFDLVKEYRNIDWKDIRK